MSVADHNTDNEKKKQRGRVVTFFAAIGSGIVGSYLFLRGKKVYLLAIGTSLYALLGLVLGEHDLNETGRLLWDAAVLSGLRAGMSNSRQEPMEKPARK